jgi:hypothetical protein
MLQGGNTCALAEIKMDKDAVQEKEHEKAKEIRAQDDKEEESKGEVLSANKGLRT